MTWWWHPPCLLRSVIVNLLGRDEALQGLLYAYRGGWLVLKDVSVVVSGEAPARMDGDVVVHRDQVSFLQVL